MVLVLTYDALVVYASNGRSVGLLSTPLCSVATAQVAEAVWAFLPEHRQRVLVHIPSTQEAALFEMDDDRGRLISAMNGILTKRQCGSIRNALPNEDVLALSRPPALVGAPPVGRSPSPPPPAATTITATATATGGGGGDVRHTETERPVSPTLREAVAPPVSPYAHPAAPPPPPSHPAAAAAAAAGGGGGGPRPVSPKSSLDAWPSSP